MTIWDRFQNVLWNNSSKKLTSLGSFSFFPKNIQFLQKYIMHIIVILFFFHAIHFIIKIILMRYNFVTYSSEILEKFRLYDQNSKIIHCKTSFSVQTLIVESFPDNTIFTIKIRYPSNFLLFSLLIDKIYKKRLHISISVTKIINDCNIEGKFYFSNSGHFCSKEFKQNERFCSYNLKKNFNYYSSLPQLQDQIAAQLCEFQVEFPKLLQILYISLYPTTTKNKLDINLKGYLPNSFPLTFSCIDLLVNILQIIKEEHFQKMKQN